MAARDLAHCSSGTPAGAEASRSEPAAERGLGARYRSLFVIGRGGMGAVEAALELQPEAADRADGSEYERVVALKRLLPEAAREPRRVEMFLREAKLATMLDHPNVVRAYDYGQIDGELFLAMEYVEGQALSRVLKTLAEVGGDLGPSLTAHVLADVCDGLHAAHELRDEAGQALNLVHRDVSPQNMMLGYDGHVRLLDFGIAKIETESVTKTGEVKGKTAYMSPEQAMGETIDRRSDLFGLGAVLFECLALRRMWGDGTDMDVIRRLALEEPPRLDEAAPSAPPELCAIYTRLVARDANDRPVNAHDVAAALRALAPQNRDEAARALRELLATHFGAQAEEQRRRLTSSLEEIAPEQARELRESVVPAPVATPSPARERPSTASLADATGANPVSGAGDRGPGVAAATREARSWTWMGAVALAIGAVAIWRFTSSPSSAATDTARAESRPSTALAIASALPATALPAPSVPASTSALPSASSPAATSARASASAPPAPHAPAATSTATSSPGPAPAPAPTVLPSPSAPATPRASATSSAPPHAPASTTVRPALPSPPEITPTKPPPDVDDHPF